MQTYQSTPDYYRDFISHANYKYISKHRGPSGKWVYVYKNESQRSAYKDRKKQIQESREQTEFDAYKRDRDQKERRKYAYPDRARQVKEGRDRAKSKYGLRSYKGTDFYRWRANAEGWKDHSSKQMKTLARRTGSTIGGDNEVGRRTLNARINAKRKHSARIAVESTTKGYGKSSTQPSKKALEIRERNRKAAERARKNRKAK